MNLLREEARPLAFFTALLGIPLSVGGLVVGGPIAAVFFAAAVCFGSALIVVLILAAEYL